MPFMIDGNDCHETRSDLIDALKSAFCLLMPFAILHVLEMRSWPQIFDHIMIWIVIAMIKSSIRIDAVNQFPSQPMSIISLPINDYVAMAIVADSARDLAFDRPW